MESAAKTGETSGPAFDRLVEDVLQNPEKVETGDLSEEQVLALQRRLNPYGPGPAAGAPPGRKRVAAASFTNLREDYLRRFTMTSLVGFLFRMLREWEVPAEVRRWTPRKTAKKNRDKDTAPFDTETLVKHAEGVAELARLAKQAEAEADAAERDFKEFSNDGLIFEEKEKKPGEDPELQKTLEEAKKRYEQSQAARAKAWGLRYTATLEARKMGFEADDRYTATEEAAREYPQVRQVLDSSTDQSAVRGRLPGGQQEMPKDNAKKVIEDFLANWFEFNPDAHVRRSYDEVALKRELERTPVPGLKGAQPRDTADPERLPAEALREEPQIDDSHPDAPELRDALEQLKRDRGTALAVLRDPDFGKAIQKAVDRRDLFRRLLAPLARDSPTRPALETAPPRDTFFRWGYYTEVNYEELREITATLYPEKPDLDWALYLYDTFEGTQEEIDSQLEKFRDNHSDEVISDIKAVEFNAWTLLADFKEARERANIYNKHTGVLKRILDRHAEDRRLGEDLMRKRVKRKKAEEIKEQGPDAPGLKQYASEAGRPAGRKVIPEDEMQRLNRAGGDLARAREYQHYDELKKKVEDLDAQAKEGELSAEKSRELESARKELAQAREMLEVPDNAIQVDVWTHDAQEGQLNKSHFYTEAEDPKDTKEEATAGRATSSAAGASGGRTGQASSAKTADHPRSEEEALPESVRRGGRRTLAPFARQFAEKLDKGEMPEVIEGGSDSKSKQGSPLARDARRRRQAAGDRRQQQPEK
jgi:hypothetical protein